VARRIQPLSCPMVDALHAGAISLVNWGELEWVVTTLILILLGDILTCHDPVF
jgi:hypothetical protein